VVIYIKQYSLVLDVKIMIQTIKILFDKVSSRGVDETAEPDENIHLPAEGSLGCPATSTLIK
jgi:hypothetical protein